MRPKGTDEQLARRLSQGLKSLGQGKSSKEVVELLGLKERSVRRWRQEAKSLKKKSESPPGRLNRLTSEQVKQLEHKLLRGAYSLGYGEDYWTLEQIDRLIWV